MIVSIRRDYDNWISWGDHFFNTIFFWIYFILYIYINILIYEKTNNWSKNPDNIVGVETPNRNTDLYDAVV